MTDRPETKPTRTMAQLIKTANEGQKGLDYRLFQCPDNPDTALLLYAGQEVDRLGRADLQELID